MADLNQQNQSAGQGQQPQPQGGIDAAGKKKPSKLGNLARTGFLAVAIAATGGGAAAAAGGAAGGAGAGAAGGGAAAAAGEAGAGAGAVGGGPMSTLNRLRSGSNALGGAGGGPGGPGGPAGAGGPQGGAAPGGGAGGNLASRFGGKATSALQEEMGGMNPQDAARLAKGDVKGAAKSALKQGQSKLFWWLLGFYIPTIGLTIFAIDFLWWFGKLWDIEYTRTQKFISVGLTFLALFVYISVPILLLAIFCNSPAGYLERFVGFIASLISSYKSICKPLQVI